MLQRKENLPSHFTYQIALHRSNGATQTVLFFPETLH